MLSLALAFELKRLLRSRASGIALLAFFAIGALAIVSGQLKIAQWNSALEAGIAAQAQSVTEARDYLSRGETGPPDRAWVDLSQPLWQDWYSGTRVGRDPDALAGIAAGAVDSAPAVFRISRLADPLAAGGYPIENPELAVAKIDLVLVIGVLLPLLIGVLGMDVGSRERETRLEFLIAVQAGATWRWLLARILAISLIAAVAAAALSVAAGLAGGAGSGELTVLSLISAGYAVLWAGLLLIVAAGARSVRAAAFGFGALWSVLCVLLPSLGSEFAVSRIASDFAVDQTLKARALRYAAYEQEAEDVIDTLYELYPALKDAPAAADDSLDPMIARHAYDAMVFVAVEERHRQRYEREQESFALAQAMAWLSPAVALSLVFERLAGVGPEAASAYRGYLMDAVAKRMNWVLSRAWAKQPLGAADFERLLASQTPNFKTDSSPLTKLLLPLLVWTCVVWMVGFSRLRRRGS